MMEESNQRPDNENLWVLRREQREAYTNPGRRVSVRNQAGQIIRVADGCDP